jgi:hypothetical protein
VNAAPLDVAAIRRHFLFPQLGRVVTNNAASTQPPVAAVSAVAAINADRTATKASWYRFWSRQPEPAVPA